LAAAAKRAFRCMKWEVNQQRTRSKEQSYNVAYCRQCAQKDKKNKKQAKLNLPTDGHTLVQALDVIRILTWKDAESV